MDESKYGVHRTHCCVLHGCKYGDYDCPVAKEIIQQDYTCESCDMDGIKNIQQIQKVIKYKNQTDENLLDEYADLWRENGVFSPEPFNDEEREKVTSLKNEIMRRMFQWT